MENTFEPTKSVSERYSLENLAKQQGMSVDEYKLEINKRNYVEQKMIDEQLEKGLTLEQAENHVLRRLYIDGFSGATFK